MASTVWKGHIAFGMVSFPVKLHAAARSQSVAFHLLHECDHSRVKQVLYCQAEDQPVSRTDLGKGFEYDKDRYVVVDEHDLTRAEPRTARLMEVLRFVPAARVDPVYLDTSYYVVPEAAGQRPYTLLFHALSQSGYVAMAQWTAFNREHIVPLRPGRYGLILHTLYYQDEVRAEDEFHIDTAQIPDRELELARLLIDALAAGFEPAEYRDRYRENLRALIEAKIRGQDIADGVAEPVRPAVLDIVKALETSLARAKKPASVANGAGAGPVDADTEICRRPKRRA
jgi:DNA end-binding protein Ku